MVIDSYTYFENATKTCLIPYGLHTEDAVLLNNPPFIVVFNVVDGHNLHIENIHEYDSQNIKKVLFDEIGVWKINYKQTDA